MSIATLLSQHHQVTAVDIVPEKVEMINNRKSPIQDDYIEKYLAEKELNLTATLDAKAAYADADFVVIAAPTNYDSHTQHFDTSAVEAVIKLVMEYNPNAIMVIKSTIPVGYTASVREKFGSKNIIFSPEFLRESKALYDNLYPSRIIVGTDLNDERLVEAAHRKIQIDSNTKHHYKNIECCLCIRQARQEPYRVRRIERKIRQLTAEKAHTQGIKEKLYGDYAEEILTREDFLNYNELYSKRIEEYDRKIMELEAEQQNLQTAPNAYPFLDVYRKYRKLEEITRPMVVELIEKIEVYEGNRVEITFRFHDEIADLLEELHQKQMGQHEASA